MRRLKEDLGITLERTGERDYWTDNEGQEIHFKLKNPPKNKFIDLDTFVIYCELRREDQVAPTYKIKLRLLFSALEGSSRYLYYADIQRVGDSNVYYESSNVVDSYGLMVSLNQYEGDDSNGKISIEKFEDEKFKYLENVHIYYAYTTLQEFVYIEQ